MTQDFYFELMRDKKASLLEKVNSVLGTSQPVISKAKDVVTVRGKKLIYRFSDCYLPIKGQQDRHFPPVEKLDYENYLVAVLE